MANRDPRAVGAKFDTRDVGQTNNRAVACRLDHHVFKLFDARQAAARRDRRVDQLLGRRRQSAQLPGRDLRVLCRQRRGDVGAWQQIKSAGGNLMDAASAPFRMAGKLWDGLTSGAQTVAAKAGAIFGGLKQSLFGDTPELAITPPKVNAWDALATGAVTVRDRIVATLSAVPGAVGRIFASTGTEGQSLWQRLSSGASAGIQAIKDRSTGIANGLLSSARAMLGVQTPIPQVAEQKQPLGATPPAESIGQRIIESVRLLRKMGLQAIICTPPDKVSDIMPIADRTLLVDKHKYRMHILPFSKENAQ